jgi:hypothetical protein
MAVTNDIDMQSAVQALCSANGSSDLNKEIDRIKGDVIEWRGRVEEIGSGFGDEVCLVLAVVVRSSAGDQSCKWTVRVFTGESRQDAEQYERRDVVFRGKVLDLIGSGVNSIRVQPASVQLVDPPL